MKLTWLGHAGFKIETDKVIYIDPYLPVKGKADLILITHNHYDHFVKKNIEELSVENTKLVGPQEVVAEIDGILVKEGDVIDVDGVKIEVTAAYNIKKENHPRGKGVGYIIEVEGKKIYHLGDTDLIPEMNAYESDIALLPVGGTYTMDCDEAASAINVLLPGIAIPMHYGEIVGNEEDALHFKEEVERETEVEVKILEKEKSVEF